MPGIRGGFDDHMITCTQVLLQPPFQICVLHSHRLKHYSSLSSHTCHHTIVLMNVQCYIPSCTSCISVFIHARLSLSLREGRGFSPAPCRRHRRAVNDTHRFGLFVPDEDPPGNQVTPRVEVAPSLMGG